MTAAWLAALGQATACRTPTSAGTKESVDGGTATADLPTVSTDTDGLALIAKTIMGIDPQSRDAKMNLASPSRGGLIQIAYLLGYELPDNDCGAVWSVTIDRTSSPNDVIVALQAPPQRRRRRWVRAGLPAPTSTLISL